MRVGGRARLCRRERGRAPTGNDVVMVPLAHGMSGGALRGFVAAAAFTFLLCVQVSILDLVDAAGGGGSFDVKRYVGGVVVVGLFALLLATVVGIVGGALLGTALVPLVNRWPASRRSLMAGAGLAFLLAGLVAFPAIPLGSGTVSDVQEALSLKVLPAVLTGAAAAWHVGGLHRLRDQLRAGAVPGAPQRARPTGAASDG